VGPGEEGAAAQIGAPISWGDIMGMANASDQAPQSKKQETPPPEENAVKMPVSWADVLGLAEDEPGDHGEAAGG